ncbi:MAG: hypothetical protein OEX81_00745 [Candidatus Pacebacteria bacterium]|nr:hypothetical protein [Candidatus Paceibacterota bacterium]
MSDKEKERQLLPTKLIIPICAALPFNMVVLRDEDSGNCIAVTEDGECPYAKKSHNVKNKFKCDKNTLMKVDSPRLVTQ